MVVLHRSPKAHELDLKIVSECQVFQTFQEIGETITSGFIDPRPVRETLVLFPKHATLVSAKNEAAACSSAFLNDVVVCAGPNDRSDDVEVVNAVIEGMPE